MTGYPVKTSLAPNAGSTLVDAHVHLYSIYDPERFLRSACRNLDRIRNQLGLPQSGFALCFTEDSRHDAFDDLASKRQLGGLEFHPTDDREAITVAFESHRMHLIAGRQIITREGLELLALGLRSRIPDGLALAEGIARVRAEGAVAVVPWAFGKWWGRRGGVLRQALGDPDPPDLGDNSARPAGVPAPALFGLARSVGRSVLPGTDPLPLVGHENRAGSYGFVLETVLSDRNPARDLKAALRSLDGSPRDFGRRVGPWQFVRDQLSLRTRSGRVR